MSSLLHRRKFIQAGLLAGSAAAGLSCRESSLLRAAPSNDAGAIPKSAATSVNKIPEGKIGREIFSRLISGGNLISGWCHSRDLLFIRDLAAAYLTEKKQYDTLELMEQKGINAIVIDMDQQKIIQKYHEERGGEIQTIVAVRERWRNWDRPDWNDLKANIDKAAEYRPDTLFLHGGYCDRLIQAGKPEHVELLGKALNYIREQGFSAGLGSHSIYVPLECDKMGIEPDYYFKTFHHDQYWSATPKERRKKFCVDGPKNLDHNEFHDNIFCIDAEETIDFMKKKKQPWIAFKVLAAGAIPPQSGFQYSFENGADFIAVGMFDFNVAEDVETVVKVLKSLQQRQRPWCS